jgi:hypothetical protein
VLKATWRWSVWCVLLATAGLADEPKGGDVEAAKRLWDPQKMMQKACDGISLHYNLDDAQKEKTCKMLTERVSKFLEKHDKELWPLLAEMAPYQFRGDLPQPDVAQRIANRGYHIFEDARQEILRAQDDFRVFLNDEQKQIHDRDLRNLHNQLSGIDRSFSEWKTGKVGRNGPLEQVRLAGNQQLVPKASQPANVRLNSYEGKWERHVKEFIGRFELDESQKGRAQAILQDLKEQASQYSRQNKEHFEEAERTLAEAKAQQPLDLGKVEQAQRLSDVLYQPFEDWFSELKNRLEQIPTEKQRQDEAQRQAPKAAKRAAPPEPPAPKETPEGESKPPAKADEPKPAPPSPPAPEPSKDPGL